MLRGSTPLRHADERAAVHEDVAVAPRLLRDPLDEVVPIAKINKLGDVTKAGVSNYALETTFAALPDSSGNNAYEYTATVAKS